MTGHDIAAKLHALAKRFPMPYYQDNRFLHDAADYIEKLERDNEDLAERLAIMAEGCGLAEPDPEWPPMDEE